MQSWFRTIFSTSFSLIIIFSVYISWPWLYAAYIWHENTIESLDFQQENFSFNSTNIPRIIHQTYRDSFSIPYEWKQASNSCRIIHSNYTYMFWSDNDGRRLIEKEFPCLLSTFDSYKYDIQRADVIRLIVLYVYGGIYLDFDIICLKSLEYLLNYHFILPRTKPVGLSNDFLMSEPKHPFLLKVLNDLPQHNRNYITKYPTVMFSTGPMFLTHEASSYSDRSSLDILSPELYGKYVYNSSKSLFQHLKASSWHGNDVSIIKWIYHKRIVILCILVLFLIMSLILIYLSERYIDINETKNKMYISKYRKSIPLILLTFLIFLFIFYTIE